MNLSLELQRYLYRYMAIVRKKSDFFQKSDFFVSMIHTWAGESTGMV